MCVFWVIPYGGEKTHKTKIPPKSRDNAVKILFTCFFLYVFFFRSLYDVPWFGDWGRVQVGGGGVVSCGKKGEMGEGWGGEGVEWGPAKGPTSQCARICQNYPL